MLRATPDEVTLGAVTSVMSVFLAQAPEASETLGAALLRAQTAWTRQAAGGDATVLAYDRGVTELVGQLSTARLQLAEAQVHARELAATERALKSVHPSELSDVGRALHRSRLAELEAARAKVRQEHGQLCRASTWALAELSGRVAGKIDTLTVAHRACGGDAGASGPFCANLPDAITMYESLLAAAQRERAALNARCAPDV